MNHIHQIAGFNLPHISAENPLGRVLSASLKTRSENVFIPINSSCQYWDAVHFGLEKVKVFQDASVDEQNEILNIANYGLLEEAYFVEKAGMGYMAKMVLLAETTEERMLYALFTSDEATHLAQISRFLPQQPPIADNAFLRFLADLVESQDKTVLLFVIQMILEGWGLSHYRSLAKDCQDLNLAAMFTEFLQAESQHHATGFTLFNQSSISQASREAIVQTLSLFLGMVQVGPQSVVGAIERVKGHLSNQQKLRIFEELDTETHSGTRLNLLRSLMRGNEAATIVQELDDRGAFQPFPPEKCL